MHQMRKKKVAGLSNNQILFEVEDLRLYFFVKLTDQCAP